MIPRISIVLPTYNRADTILRAIASVRAQAFDDWELLIVDDGSTDDTQARIQGIDPRVRIFSQENRGVAHARNRALEASRGELIAFLDSDDHWTTHHLGLASAFFAAHPGEHLYSSELWEDFGKGFVVKHFRPEIFEWFPETAVKIGSSRFAGAAPRGDGYLRVYAEREELGAWARGAVDPALHPGAFHYRGEIFDHWRWGWLMALMPTVITRHALETIGPFDARIPVANDFSWLALLCKRFTANYFSLPGAVKHELAQGGASLSESHLATGKTAVQFHRDVLALHDELFWNDAPNDPELSALRGFRQYLVAQAAARGGMRDVALEHLRLSRATYPAWEARELAWLLELLPTDALARRAYGITALPSRIRSRWIHLRDRLAHTAGGP